MQDPLYDPLTQGLPGMLRGQAEMDNPVSPAAPGDLENPLADLNSRIQETDLLGVGLGDCVTGAKLGPFEVSLKALTTNVATITFKQAQCAACDRSWPTASTWSRCRPGWPLFWATE